MRIKGIAVAGGIAFGQAIVVTPYHSQLDYHLIPPAQLGIEQARLDKALASLIQQIKHSAQHLDPNSEHYQLIEADLLLLEDADLQAELRAAITEQQFSAALAVEHTFAKQAQALQAMDSPYLASRSDDILALGQRVITTLLTGKCSTLTELPRNSIVIAKDITPAEFALLPLENLAGLVLQTGGITSHSAILARSFDIPTLVGCECNLNDIVDGTPVAIDTLNGLLFIDPDAEQVARLTLAQQQTLLRKTELLKFKDHPTQTSDGHPIALLANVGCISEINHLSSVGGEGVGLFRTEFMLMNRQQLPDEQQQYQLYCDALQLLNGRILTIRTIDIGADKEVPALAMPVEENPALGLRGVRYTLAHPQLFCVQLKAILRAANQGPIRLMFPMVNQVEELETILALIEQCKAELIEQEKGYGPLSMGIVVETPAAVLNLASMLPLLDFISIGTNDLTQYTMAADRGNPELIKRYPVLSPALIKLISQTINQAHAAKVTVSLCGELASNPRATALLVGLGIDELSVSVAALLEIKQELSRWTYIECVELAQHAKVISRIETLNELLTCCHS
ncbi:phosphoenolpyruvate--protein phosphotransferase [Shewanella algidipiscicola]|uniref:phosphoenolpyruvate--protein phosphotransferase n=1 Tax=Shewanella algidipiscicola TaxID=614070 RepID=UPI000D788402|nr:phosphoenolpyruvate--protein phosphotransferase [Shewanella algidipiscicola]